ncbi:family 10 glycosylhydrolase, partial [Leptolyngbya sp. FACHB-36]|uniref:family 10 glycosylhydrolase n=1 Tax=Leptolyngbya sp. FACHB-36 TaxID=2692808 RepID=UPI001680C353
MKLVQLAILNRCLIATAITSSLLGHTLTLPAHAQSTPYCQQITEAIAQKDRLRQAAMQGDRGAQKQYRRTIDLHAEYLRNCRKKAWPSNEAIWLRLYPCDTRDGAIEAVLDRIVNRGYNQVNIEVFYNSKVLLPANGNPTVWSSVLAGTKAENRDLLAEVIKKGRERGLKVYAWLFTMNFGSNYFRRDDRQQTIARNGWGQTSITARTVAGLSVELGQSTPDEAFIDPYSAEARRDYAQLVQTIAQRKPDGILFDYIRYPRGSGPASVASRVQDLWIYGEASHRALLKRALNYRGMELIQRYLNNGSISADDLKAATVLYPREGEPQWQGRNPGANTAKLPLARRAARLQAELWQLTSSHAAQGVLDFLSTAIEPVQRSRISSG